jgi:hypothetical protein
MRPQDGKKTQVKTEPGLASQEDKGRATRDSEAKEVDADELLQASKATAT